MQWFKAETTARLIRGLGWWTIVEDDHGVVITQSINKSKRTIFIDHCTAETLFDETPNIHTLASNIPDYCISIDETLRLIMEYTRHTCSIRTSEDPSGAGCDLTWWPEGLSGMEIKAHCTHEQVQLAMLWCFVEVVLKHSWFMKLPDSKYDEENSDA